MPRPVKPRKVSFIPDQKLFVPYGKKLCKKNIIQIKHEEIEALRLKDIESLHQSECAEIMGVSRQTFQLILDSARTKLTKSVINGQAFKIEGGNFEEISCKKRCLKCGTIYNKDNCLNKCCKK